LELALAPIELPSAARSADSQLGFVQRDPCETWRRQRIAAAPVGCGPGHALELKLTCHFRLLQLIHELSEPKRHSAPLAAPPFRATRRGVLEQRVPIYPPRFSAHGVVGRSALTRASRSHLPMAGLRRISEVLAGGPTIEGRAEQLDDLWFFTEAAFSGRAHDVFGRNGCMRGRVR
jgi:hypothetical protein